MTESIVKLAEDLIRIPGYAELEEKETKTAELLCRKLTEMGLEARLINTGESRYNVECVIRGIGKGKSLLLCTHLDTVPAYGMKNAFSPTIKEGKLYGRGAVDVKGILAAMAFAMKRVLDEGIPLKGDVIFLAVADEESGSLGMRSAMRTWVQNCDAAVIGEATHLNLGVAHKGVVWIEVSFQGKSTHGSTPESGINAVYHAAAFLEKIRKQLIPQLDNRKNLLLGRSTINAGYIRGGTRPTIVPDQCLVQLDRRLLPEEELAGVQEEIRKVLEDMKREIPEVSYEIRIILGDDKKPFPSLYSDPDQEVVQCLAGSIEKVTGKKPELTGLPFWTDGALFSYKTGKPAVICGPGFIEQAHSDMEFIDVEELKVSSDIYYQMILDICS